MSEESTRDAVARLLAAGLRPYEIAGLQILCPNCHALTDTWGGRNKGRVVA